MSDQDFSDKFKAMNMYDDCAPRRFQPNEGSSRSQPANPPITLEKTTSILKKDLPYQAQKFIARPEKMVQNLKLGSKIRLSTNFVALTTNAKPIRLHQYNVEIYAGRKQITKREKCSPLFWKLVSQLQDEVFPPLEDFVYNDVNILWSKVTLKNVPGHAEFGLRNRRGIEKVHFVIKYAGMIEFSENATLDSDRDLTITIIDAIVTQRARCHLRNLGGDGEWFVAARNAIFSREYETRNRQVRLTIPLGSGLEALTGLHFAAKLHLQMGPAANIDLSHSVFHRPRYSLVRLLADIIIGHATDDEEFERCAAQIKNYGMSAENRRNVEKLLRGKHCIATTVATKRFRFTKLTDRAANAIVIQDDNGVSIRVSEFYNNRQHRLQFPNLPCVVGPPMRNGSGSQLFPIEFVATVDEIQKFKGKVADHLAHKMIRETAYKPTERFETIKTLALEGVPRGCPPVVTQDPWMESFNINVGSEFVEVDATVLPTPKLVYGNSSYHDTYHHGVWETVTDNKFKTVLSNRCETTGLVKYIVPSLITVQNPQLPSNQNIQIDLKHIHTIMETLENFGQPIWRDNSGKMSIPGVYYIGTHHQNFGANSLRDQLLEIKNHMATNENFKTSGVKIIPLIFFVFANRATTINSRLVNITSDYGIIKQLCDGELGMNCQGILLKTYMSISDNPATCSTSHNMAYKVLAKIGTVHYKLESGGKHKNWTILTNPESPTLVLGIDVTHAGHFAQVKGGISASSVAAVVGNIDIAISKFGESVEIQQCGQERIVSLVRPVTERIVAFNNHTGVRPKHIVIYRDGVSESEFKRTFYEEKLAIDRACETLDKGFKPTITYIVVTKRHHTRFNALRKEDTEGLAFNIKPGTLVENTICSNNYFDFYLCSHFGPLGTSRPSHYYVLFDDWAPSPAFWQTITFALCYLYVACSKSISIPNVVQYAHLCAKRAKDRLLAIEEIKRDRNERFNLNEFEEYARVMDLMKPHEDLPGILYA